MPRIARVVVPGYAHHVTQRGNRRQQTFFGADDYVAYRELMAEWYRPCGVGVWAYCPMPNHVHLIAVPTSEDGLRRTVGEAHRRYTRRVNFRERWRGHLWQGRFASFVLDDYHLLTAARYVEMNPVRARLVARAKEYRWSSAGAHLAGRDDALVKVGPLLSMTGNWRVFLGKATSVAVRSRLQRHERTGRPLGDDEFIARLKATVNRVLTPRKAGRKPKKQPR
jgi:putative transposase